MQTKMEGGRDEGEGEKRPAKEERNHTVHTCLATTCPFSPPHKAPLPTVLSPNATITETSQALGLCPQLSSPETPWGKMSGPSQTPSHSSRQKVASRDKSPSPPSRGWGEPFREGRSGTHPHPVSLPLPLLRMCLPDILCPRFSPEGPERPARTEDASRGESHICGARGLRRALEGAGGSPPS